jgi:hypothetical protein
MLMLLNLRKRFTLELRNDIGRGVGTFCRERRGPLQIAPCPASVYPKKDGRAPPPVNHSFGRRRPTRSLQKPNGYVSKSPEQVTRRGVTSVEVLTATQSSWYLMSCFVRAVSSVG